MSQAGLDAVPAEAARLATPDAVRDAVAAEMRAHLEDLDLEDLVDGDEHRARHAEVQLRLALLAHKRRALVDLRNTGRIDDGVLQHVQRTLDGRRGPARDPRALHPARRDRHPGRSSLNQGNIPFAAAPRDLTVRDRNRRALRPQDAAAAV